MVEFPGRARSGRRRNGPLGEDRDQLICGNAARYGCPRPLVELVGSPARKSLQYQMKNPFRLSGRGVKNAGLKLELIDDVCSEQPLVLKARLRILAAATPGFLSTHGVVPAQFEAADHILPEVVLRGCGQCENLVGIGRPGWIKC